MLDGLQKIPEMLDRIVELGMDSVALTDHGTLSGAIDFYKGCKDRNLRPLSAWKRMLPTENIQTKIRVLIVLAII